MLQLIKGHTYGHVPLEDDAIMRSSQSTRGRRADGSAGKQGLEAPRAELHSCAGEEKQEARGTAKGGRAGTKVSNIFLAATSTNSDSLLAPETILPPCLYG